ncbi:MAG: hypothetical protein ABI693_25335 [Bryobacteraceae bacterium]
MNQTPPGAATVILRLMVPEADAEAIEGDLFEEFTYIILPRHGAPVARRWYWRQVFRSSPSLISLLIRRGEVAPLLAAAAAGVVLPLLGLETLWSIVLSLVPLKTGTVRPDAFLWANVSVVLLGSVAAGLLTQPRSSMCLAVLALIFATTFLAAQPLWCGLLLLAVAPAGTLAGAFVRRYFERNQP